MGSDGMTTYFTPEFFKGNRARLRKLFTGTAPIVITANSLLQRNSDIAYPFRQDSNFWYLTGITEPDFVLVMDRDKEYLISPVRNQIRTIFDGGLDPEIITQRSGIKEIIDAKNGWKNFSRRLQRVQHVATIAAPPNYIENYEFYTNPARANLISKLKLAKPELEFLDLKEHFATMRVLKHPQEINAIKDSVNLTASALRKLKSKLSKMKYEYEVEAFLSQAFRSQGALHGYNPMVAGGINACTLHYDENNKELNKRDLLLIDAGAEKEYYSADLTRTYALGAPTKRQQAVYDAVLEVQDYVLSNIKPGITLKESEKLSEQFMGEKLRELGLIKAIEKKTVRHYFPHAASHYLGLDLHDAGDYNTPMEADMVITVEPGIYIPEEGIGIRIEDDILITNNGHKVLSAGLPRTLT